MRCWFLRIRFGVVVEYVVVVCVDVDVVEDFGVIVDL